jgi:hypothetical protein
VMAFCCVSGMAIRCTEYARHHDHVTLMTAKACTAPTLAWALLCVAIGIVVHVILCCTRQSGNSQ